MRDTQDKIKWMLLGTVVGDALGTPLDSLSRQHIKSIYKTINNYTDAAPALKGRLDQWKKPGLYSSAAQLMILLSIYAISNKHIDARKFIQFNKTLPETAGNEYGIFRHPSQVIKHFVQNTKPINNAPGLPAFSSACARSAIILIPLAIPDLLPDDNYIANLVSFSLMLNKDMYSVAGSLIINTLLRRIIKESVSENILTLAADALSSLHKNLEILSAQLFDSGIIPDYLHNSLRDYSNIFTAIVKIKDIASAEKAIYTYVNTKIKTPITRATANHPLAIIPFSIFFTDLHLNRPSEIIFRAAECGGSTSVLCALAGAFSGSVNGQYGIAENLLEELINKKRIINLAEAISGGKRSNELVHNELVRDFLQNEASLTSKEIQEKNARLKHVKIKSKKPKSRQERERELSAHVVETWTKLDKAKWKKKSKKHSLYKDNQ